MCLEESFKYALKRKTFGKVLMEHPVIRAKIAEMARQVECTHSQLENITYQMCTMSKKDAMEKARCTGDAGSLSCADAQNRHAHSQLGGPTALLKAQSTKVFEFCAREAAQIFGGASCASPAARARCPHSLTRRGTRCRCARRSGREGRAPVPRSARIRGALNLMLHELRGVCAAHLPPSPAQIPGGSEEIMLDLAVRQAMKDAKLAKL